MGARRASGPVAEPRVVRGTAPQTDPVRLELARIAARVRLAWWTEVGAQRFARSPRSGDEVDAELVRLAALGERPPAAEVQRDDPQLEELAEHLREREAAC